MHGAISHENQTDGFLIYQAGRANCNGKICKLGSRAEGKYFLKWKYVLFETSDGKKYLRAVLYIHGKFNISRTTYLKLDFRQLYKEMVYEKYTTSTYL